MDLQKQLDLSLQHVLLHGSHPEVIDLLLNAGADPKIMDRQAALNSALQYAIRSCHPAVVELLLNAGANIPPNMDFSNIGVLLCRNRFEEWYNIGCLKIYDLIAQSVNPTLNIFNCHSTRLIDQIINDFPAYFHSHEMLRYALTTSFEQDEELIELNADINIDYGKIEYVQLFISKKFTTLEKINDLFPGLLCNDKVLPAVIDIYFNDEYYEKLIKLLYEFGNSINENNVVAFAKKLLLRWYHPRTVIWNFSRSKKILRACF